MAVMRLEKEREVRSAEGGEMAISPRGQKRLQEKILPKTRAAEDSTATKAPARKRAATRRKTGSTTKKATARVAATK